MAKRKGDTFSPCLTSISQLKKSENVCPDFTDFKKAFDTIWRAE
jgi:hypothetical protein